MQTRLDLKHKVHWLCTKRSVSFWVSMSVLSLVESCILIILWYPSHDFLTLLLTTTRPTTIHNSMSSPTVHQVCLFYSIVFWMILARSNELEILGLALTLELCWELWVRVLAQKRRMNSWQIPNLKCLFSKHSCLWLSAKIHCGLKSWSVHPYHPL